MTVTFCVPLPTAIPARASLGASFQACTPRPYRPWIGNWLAANRLALPVVVIRNTSPGRGRISIPTRRSSPASLIPITPAATIPMGRTSSSWKRMAMPEEVESRTWFLPLLIRTQPSWSPSFTLTRVNRFAEGPGSSPMAVFLIIPCRVAVTTNHFSRPEESLSFPFRSGMEKTSANRCSSFRGKIFITGVPSEGSSDSGMAWTGCAAHSPCSQAR